jgi:hypothetical protein
MPLVRPTFVGMHDKLASHGFAPNEMTQLAPLGAASAEFNEDDARNAAQINNKGKRKLLLIIARIRSTTIIMPSSSTTVLKSTAWWPWHGTKVKNSLLVITGNYLVKQGHSAQNQGILSPRMRRPLLPKNRDIDSQSMHGCFGQKRPSPEMNS